MFGVPLKRTTSIKGVFRKSMVLNPAVPTKSNPTKNVYSTHWTWEIPFDIVKETVLLHEVGLLSMGFLDTAAKKELLKLPSDLALRRFDSKPMCCISPVSALVHVHIHSII